MPTPSKQEVESAFAKYGPAVRACGYVSVQLCPWDHAVYDWIMIGILVCAPMATAGSRGCTATAITNEWTSSSKVTWSEQRRQGFLDACSDGLVEAGHGTALIVACSAASCGACSKGTDSDQEQGARCGQGVDDGPS